MRRRYVQWCHGAPGFIALLAKAYQLLDDSSPESAAGKQQVLAAAKKAADVIWERGLLTKVRHDVLSLLLPICTKNAANLLVHTARKTCSVSFCFQ